MYKNVILHLVFCGCETWSPIVWEGHAGICEQSLQGEHVVTWLEKIT